MQHSEENPASIKQYRQRLSLALRLGFGLLTVILVLGVLCIAFPKLFPPVTKLLARPAGNVSQPQPGSAALEDTAIRVPSPALKVIPAPDWMVQKVQAAWADGSHVRGVRITLEEGPGFMHRAVLNDKGKCHHSYTISCRCGHKADISPGLGDVVYADPQALAIWYSGQICETCRRRAMPGDPPEPELKDGVRVVFGGADGE